MVQQRELPKNFIYCEKQDLIILISRMLKSLIKINDGINKLDETLISSENLTRFHSRTPPGISVFSYLARLAKYSSLENAVLLSTIYYIDLLSSVYKSFTLNSLTVHRFLLTATTVGTKGLCDSFCTNNHYAKVGGIHINELEILEREFLIKLNYKILPRDIQLYKEGAGSSMERSKERRTENMDYNVLDLYYKKMIALVGKEYNIDDDESAITESIEFLLSSRHGSTQQQHEDEILTNSGHHIIKTNPDTLPDEIFVKKMRMLKSERLQQQMLPLQLQPVSQNANVVPRAQMQPAAEIKTPLAHPRAAALKTATVNTASTGISPKSPLKRPINPDEELQFVPKAKKKN